VALYFLWHTYHPMRTALVYLKSWLTCFISSWYIHYFLYDDLSVIDTPFFLTSNQILASIKFLGFCKVSFPLSTYFISYQICLLPFQRQDRKGGGGCSVRTIYIRKRISQKLLINTRIPKIWHHSAFVSNLYFCQIGVVFFYISLKQCKRPHPPRRQSAKTTTHIYCVFHYGGIFFGWQEVLLIKKSWSTTIITTNMGLAGQCPTQTILP
jgi:hypothetical protein